MRSAVVLITAAVIAILMSGCMSCMLCSTDSASAATGSAAGQSDSTPATATLGQAAPAFTLTAADGSQVSLADHAGSIVVLEWVNFGCPFVVKHYGSGNMQALQQRYAQQGVVWLAICSSAPGKQGHYAGDALTQQIASQSFAGAAYLIDADGAVGKAYGARTTPHMYVIAADGTLAYQGAIDSVPSTDPSDIPQATNHVAAALDALLAGEAVATPATQAYGCSVKYP